MTRVIVPPQYRERVRSAIGLPNRAKTARVRRFHSPIRMEWIENMVTLGLAVREECEDPLSGWMYEFTTDAMRQCLRGRERLPVSWVREDSR